MQPGDLVRYRNSEFVTTRVHETLVGLVLEIRQRQRDLQNRKVLVRWNCKEERFRQMWHDSSALEVVDELN